MSAVSQLALPVNYRSADIIAYHLRDPARISEKLDVDILYKGFMWDSEPACLELRFDDNVASARLDSRHPAIDQASLDALLTRMLGLEQDINGFEQAVASHPQLRLLTQQQSGLRVPVATSPFEALVWAIIGQQISIQAAISIRARFIQTAGIPYSDTLWCHPDAQAVASTSPDALRQAGLSSAKVRTLLTVSQAILNNDLTLPDTLNTVPATALQEQLMAIRGIGPWTADYTLLRGYGWLDGSLHGDAAVRRGLRKLLQNEDPVSPEFTRNWLMEFSPWRALVAAHLWASQKLQA